MVETLEGTLEGIADESPSNVRDDNSLIQIFAEVSGLNGNLDQIARANQISSTNVEELITSSIQYSQSISDVETHYVDDSQTALPYLSYDQGAEAVKVEHLEDMEAKIEDEARVEVYRAKMTSAAGQKYERCFQNEHEQKATEWYKIINAFWLMLMYDLAG